MSIEKKFIIFLIILLFSKQLSSITPTPIVSYNGTNPTSYAGNNVPLYSLSWDGITNRILVGGTGKYDQLFFTGTSLNINGWQGGYNACVACKPQGIYGAAAFASGAYSGHIKIYDFDNNSQALDYPGQLSQYFNLTYQINLLAWSPDGTKLAAIYNNNTLKIYSISITPYSNGNYASATLTLLGSSSELSSTVTALSWNQSSTAIAVTATSLYIYNTGGSLLSTISGSFTASSWNPSSSMNLYLAACSSSGTISIYKFSSISTAPTTTTFTKDFIATTYGNPTKIAWSSDGIFLAICSKTNPYVKTFKFDTSSGLSNFGNPVNLPGDGTDIGWNYDNKFLALTAGTYLNIYSFSSVTSTTVITAPVASFTATPTSGPAPLSVQFTGSGTNSPTSWAWDFGDGSSSTSQNTSHSYTAVGSYTVKLTATNSGGSNSTTKTITVTVTTPPPVASFTSSASGLTATFKDSSTNSPTSWAWDFGDGSTSTSQNPSHTYAASGTYSVTLVSSNSSGNNSTTMKITVTSGSTNVIQESLNAIKTYDSTGLDSMLNIINNSTFDNTSFQGTNGGDLIYAKLKVFYDNRANIGLFKISDGWNGLLDKAKDKAFLNDTQKQDITTRATITVTEFGLTTAVNALNSASDKLTAIKNFFANSISVDTAKNLRKARASINI